MCTDPQPFYDRVTGEVREVACRKCNRCKANRLTDIAGRAYAEALASDHVVALTLTYGDQNAGHAQVLVYSDFQKLMKRLRFDGYAVRYFVAGEYGSERGRAHWHCVLFFQGAVPELPPVETECQHWDYWTYSDGTPIGFVYVQKPEYRGILYCLKYAMKEEINLGQTDRHAMMSKKPPLGAAYWPVLARMRVEAGLPFRRRFHLPAATYADGQSVEFFLKGASLLDAYDAHRAAWYAAGHRDEPPCVIEDLAEIEKLRRQCMGWGLSDTREFEAGTVAFRDVHVSGWSIGRGYGRHFMFRIQCGEIWCLTTRNVGRKDQVKLWRVENLAQMLAIGRGKRSHTPRSLRDRRPPF